MRYAYYDSPIGRLLLAADEEGLTGLWIEGEKYYPRNLEEEHVECPEVEHVDCPEAEHTGGPAFAETRRWLDLYFAGGEPDFLPPLHMIGTGFQKEVWEILLTIPYGSTTTYGRIAQQIAQRQGRAGMSAQAVGGAVGRNRISIIIPCHRVIGADGSMTGYAGGIDKKKWLLALEQGTGSLR